MPLLDFPPDTVRSEAFLQTLFGLEADRYGPGLEETVHPIVPPLQLETAEIGSPLDVDLFAELMPTDDIPELQQHEDFSTIPSNLPNISSLEHSPDPLEEDTKDLAELNLRIYKIIRTISNQDGIIPASMPSTDEMIDITRCVLQVFDRVVARTGAGEDTRSQLSPDSLQSELEHNLNMCAIDPSMYLNNTPTLGNAPDPGTVLMMLACYQRLVDMFKYVCLSLHRHICSPVNTPHHSVEARKYGMSTNGQEFKELSNAELVMAVELMTHLADRLDRGLHQLALAMSATNNTTNPLSQFTSLHSSTTSQSSAEWCESPRFTPSTKEFEGFLSGNQKCERTDQGNNKSSCLYAAKSVVTTIVQKQAALDIHLQLLRRSIQQLDGI